MDTPLHYIVKSQYSKETKLELVQLLLHYGANSSFLGKDDESPLDVAYSNFFTEAVDLMRESLGIVIFCLRFYEEFLLKYVALMQSQCM